MSDIVSKPCGKDCQDTWDRVFRKDNMRSIINLTCESCGLRLPDVKLRPGRHGDDIALCDDCFGETMED